MTPDKTKDQLPAAGRILLVDDCDVNQLVARQYLERSGYRVDTAQNGQLALQAHQQKPYDLILMDINMPVMDGYEAARRIRNAQCDLRGTQSRRTRHLGGADSDFQSEIKKTPIVGMSGHDPASVMDQCRQAGMDDCIGKPLQRADLIAMVEKWTADNADRASTQNSDARPCRRLPGKIENQAPIDIENTLSEFMGKTDLLQTVLKTFRTTVAAQIRQIKHCLSANHYPAVLSQAHAIKGAAGNLRAFALSKAAAELEQAAGIESATRTAAAADDLEKEFHILYQYLEQSEIGSAT
jgi:CheY-like chemotaxis protein/HPt (histidine-containing phosphotransfer) domain-containing protein